MKFSMMGFADKYPKKLYSSSFKTASYKIGKSQLKALQSSLRKKKGFSFRTPA